MDSTLALALMMKAKLIFEHADTFLCFPLTPIAYTKDQLSFQTDTAMTSADLANLSSFATLVNMIPDGATWPPAQPTMLWDVYERLLREGILATAVRTAEEDARYETALRYLTVTNADGSRSDSPAVITYDRYRDAVLVAEQNYNNAEIAAKASTEPAVTAQWTAQQPALSAALDQATSDWDTLGFHHEVDAARGIVRQLGAKSPQLEWAAWTAQCNPAIDAMTDGGGSVFFPTGFAPSNIIDQSAWQQFTLGADEAKALIAQAPPELRKRLAPDSVDIAIDHLSLRYSSVVLKRAWFDPAVFAQRFWKFSDPAERLSDGVTLSNGSCPAYVMGCVFARDITVQLAAAQPQGPPTSQLPIGRPINLGAFRIGAVNVDHVTTIRQLESPPLAHVGLALNSGSSGSLRVEVAPRLQMMLRQPVLSPPPTAPGARALFSIEAAQRLRRAPTTGGPDPSAPVVPPASDPSIYVLAFICARVPASPDPDPSLTW